MSQLFETILIKNKELQNIKYHNIRLNNSRLNLWKKTDLINLERIIQIPNNIDNSLYRCRVIYDTEIKNIEFIPYTPSPIKTLQLVACNTINYKYKYQDRNELNKLKENTISDDILIVKNGLITDTSIANILFKHNQQWFTPLSPLLKGTQREKLLTAKSIIPINITPKEIRNFESFCLINALRPFDVKEECNISNIYF